MGGGDSFLKVLGIDPYKIHGCFGCWRGVGEGDGGCNNLLFLIMDVVVGLGSGRGSSCHCIRLALVWTSRRSALREACLHVAWWEGVVHPARSVSPGVGFNWMWWLVVSFVEGYAW